MVRSTWIAAGLVASLAWGCGGTEGQTNWDVGGNDVPGDLQIADTCMCTVAGDCVDKVTVNQCTFAACESCGCIAKPKPAGTVCDDGKADTVKDVCDDKGACAGHVPSCFDGKCEGPVENCATCPDDCACGSGRVCNEGKCIPKPVCGNGKCEPTEHCGNCKDCGCGVTKHCFEDKCIPCADWCKADDRQCGEDGGCNCGVCKAGEACDQIGHCYPSTICNNGKCEADQGETCASCPSDCACTGGLGCKDGKCVSCADLCEAAGQECGVYQGCVCGPCPDGYNCKANKCMPKCDWLCYNKACGEIDGCKCGDLDGACPEGEECVQYKCLKECGILCEGKECGWGEDCFCDFCPGCQACHSNTCAPGAAEDENEPNEDPETATDLGTTTDEDAASTREIKGSVHDDIDMDWFKVEVTDTGWGNFLWPVLDLTGLAEDKDLVLLLCYKCKNGDLAGAAIEPAESTYEVDTWVAGARCFETFNWWGESDHMELHPVCEGSGQDDSGTVYIGIYPYEAGDCGSGYTLKFHM